MRILLDQNNLGIFLGESFEYTESGIKFSFGVSTQYNENNTTVINTELPNPPLNYVWEWKNNEWVCIDQVEVDNYLANQTFIFNKKQKELRAEAYKNESDALFFKAQREEITMQVWLDKVNAIKTKYSYIE
jgi:hypothetical protein